MRYLKTFLTGFGAIALSFGVASAGLNPQDPGLGGGAATYNPGMSRVCVDCHTRVPASLANNGSHYVTGGTEVTRTGGGWATSGASVKRYGGEYFKFGAWPNPASGRNAPYSKYGRTSDNASMIFGTPNDNTGRSVNGTAAAIKAGEIICESCHNLVSNVAGGNNLVAPMTVATYVSGGATELAQVQGWQNSDVATLCVGCHGFMYTAAPAVAQTRNGDTRNLVDDAGTVRRGNNHVHYVDGVLKPQNHHVMTADVITQAIATEGLYWADTYIKDTSAAGWLPGSATVTTAFTAGTRGTMPMRAVWVNDGSATFGKVKSDTDTEINCIHCHSAPHAGDATTGASILRDLNASGTNTGGAVARLGEGGRTWMGFDDFNYCQDCHQLK